MPPQREQRETWSLKTYVLDEYAEDKNPHADESHVDCKP